MSSKRRPNVHPLFLPVDYYLAIVDVQAKKRIGRSAAILLMLGEGLLKEGFLSEEMFVEYKERYTKPLKDIVQGNIEAAKHKVKCSWGGCKRVAVRMVCWLGKKDEKELLAACQMHFEEAKNKPSEFEILPKDIPLSSLE
ncbi:MAG: hypothetical protein JSV51_02765 [Candidatus Bathyarchaeota archaeon]|nr:MAG: hypothetical protein JSV51_02765 [Candidatus Bathyarchaeota archaeon]